MDQMDREKIRKERGYQNKRASRRSSMSYMLRGQVRGV
jgi:hypothetical protein